MILKNKNVPHFCYKITNIINNKVYIGVTCKDILDRFKQHLKVSRGNPKKRQSLHHAISKYGAENFKIELISKHYNATNAFKAEIKNIKKFLSYKNGYNETRGGDSGPLKITRSKELIENIFKLFIDKKSVNEISKITNETISTIHDILRFKFWSGYNISKSLIKQVKILKKNSKKKHRITQEIFLKILKDYAYNNLTMDQLCQKYSYTLSTIHGMLSRKTHKQFIASDQIINDINLKIQKYWQDVYKLKQKVSKEIHQQIFQMFLLRKTMKEIGKMYNVSYSTINGILYRKRYNNYYVDPLILDQVNSLLSSAK